jgi:hypothetical protein
VGRDWAFTVQILDRDDDEIVVVLGVIVVELLGCVVSIVGFLVEIYEIL